MSYEIEVLKNLEDYSLSPAERLGQHFLVNQGYIERLVQSVLPGSKVIEVGSGFGHVTEALAQKAIQVVGIEIDRRFQPILEDVRARNHNVSFIMGDVLHIPLSSLVERDQEVQVIANLPFHITEPFLHNLVDFPMSNAVLMLGDNVVSELQADKSSTRFGKLSLLAQTFFEVRVIDRVPRTSFYPQPRTDAAVVEFQPKEKREIVSNPANYAFAYLFRKASKYGLVGNDLKQALVEASQGSGNSGLSKRELHKRDRSSARRELKQVLNEYNGFSDFVSFQNHSGNRGGAIISQSQALDTIIRMGIPDSVLSKPFFRLDNQDIRSLVIAVQGFYSGDIVSNED